MYSMGNYRFVVATTPELIDAAHRLRYQVYVEEFGYLSAQDNPGRLEKDRWDPASIQMVALNQENVVIGTIRLVLNSVLGLPTLEAVKSHYSDPYPRSAKIGEVSRLTVARSYRRRVEDGFHGVAHLAAASRQNPSDPVQGGQDRRQFAVVLGLFRILYHVSRQLGMLDWYMISEKRLWYLLKRYHIVFRPIGPAMEYHGVRVPYVGHIPEIEEHMMKVSASAFLRESVAESLNKGEDKKKANPSDSEPLTPSVRPTLAVTERGLTLPGGNEKVVTRSFVGYNQRGSHNALSYSRSVS